MGGLAFLFCGPSCWQPLCPSLLPVSPSLDWLVPRHFPPHPRLTHTRTHSHLRSSQRTCRRFSLSLFFWMRIYNFPMENSSNTTFDKFSSTNFVGINGVTVLMLLKDYREPTDRFIACHELFLFEDTFLQQRNVGWEDMAVAQCFWNWTPLCVLLVEFDCFGVYVPSILVAIQGLQG